MDGAEGEVGGEGGGAAFAEAQVEIVGRAGQRGGEALGEVDLIDVTGGDVGLYAVDGGGVGRGGEIGDGVDRINRMRSGCRRCGGEGFAEAGEEGEGRGVGDRVGDEPGAVRGVFVSDEGVVEGEFAVRDFGEVVGFCAGEFFELRAEFVAKETDCAAGEGERGRGR